MNSTDSSSCNEPLDPGEPRAPSGARELSNDAMNQPSAGVSSQAPTWEEAKTLPPGANLEPIRDDRRSKLSDTWKRLQDLEGQTLGNYHRLHQVGTWQYGLLYEAEYAQLNRKVRLITLDAPWCEHTRLKTWFLSRSRAIDKIHISSVASSVIEFGEHAGVTFIAVPARGRTTTHSLRESSQRATLTSAIEPICHSFYLLLSGLSTLHHHGMVHGAIETDHILAGDSTDEIQIDLFATGIPESKYFNEDDDALLERQNAELDDYRDLARAFIAILIGVTGRELPALVRLNWLRKQLPFLSKKLARLLTNLANEGLEAEKVPSEIGKLNQYRFEPLSQVSWREGLSTAIAVFSWGWFAIIGVGLLLVPVSVLSTPEFARKIAFPVYSIGLIILVLFNALLEGAIGKSIFREMMGFILVNRSGRLPSLKERLIRLGALLGILVPVTAILTTLFVALDPLRFPEEKWSFYCMVSLILSMLLIHASSLLLRGQPIHDWLAGTMLIFHKKIEDAPILVPNESLSSSPLIANRLFPLQSEHREYDRIENILIENELGIGGMGVVYRAFDESLQRPIALKVVTAFSADTEEIVQRFRREAQLGAILNHPNIAKVFKVGLWQDRPFMAMEYIDGNTLQQIVSTHGPVPIHLAWKWIRQAAIGLQEADNHGIIHRDIKPSNLMVTRDGIVKLMDFGISKSAIDEPNENDRRPTSPTSGNPLPNETRSGNYELTRIGALLGTPGYMAPEQARCEETDRRSDIYSLGLTLYYLLAGKSPYDGTQGCELLMQQADGKLPPIRFGHLSKEQNNLVAKMLAPAKDDRFQSYVQLISAMDLSKPDEMRLPANSRRAMAIAFDCLAWITLIVVASFAFTIYQRWTNAQTFPVAIQALIATMAFLSVLFYFIGCTVWLGGTPGQWMLGLKVQNHDGKPVEWWRASLRFVAKYPMLLLAFFLVLYFFNRALQTTQSMWILEWASVAEIFSSYILVSLNYATHRKAIHDYVAGTRIVYAKRGLLEFDLWKLFG